jgi:hypothetical protein
MDSSTPQFEEAQRALNPHRDDDVRRAAQNIVAQLMQRRIEVTEGEDSDQLASLLSAVELFESAVAARGGDSMTNAPDSRRPDNRAFVLPRRGHDESLEAYTRRVNDAADVLGPATGPTSVPEVEQF